MREMKDSGIEWVGKVPKIWSLKPIRALFDEVTEKNFLGTCSNALKFTYGSIVRKPNFDADADDYVASTILNYTVVEPGTIMLNGLNLNFDFVSQRIGLVKEKGVITSAYMAFKPNEKHLIDSEFANYLFKAYDGCKAFHNMGGGVRKILNFNEFKKYYIPLPDLNEQQHIVDLLDTKCSEIDATAEDIQKEISLLEDYKKSVITEAVTKGLNPDAEMKDSKIFYLGQINKTWNLTKVGYCCKKLYRPFEPSDEALVCSNKGKVVPRGDTLIGLMTSDDNAMQGICKGDIAIHGMDTWHGAIACSEYDGKITRVVHVCKADGDNRFVVYWLQHLAFVGVYKLISNGVRGNTSDFRSWDKVADIYVPNPIKEEQQQIADYLDIKCSEIDTIIADKKRQLDILADYKKSLIYEYVTGKKEVPVNE